MKGWSDNQRVLNDKLKIWRFVGIAVLMSCVYWIVSYDDSVSDKSFIRIAGEKPVDATVKAWANYWVTGDECESYSYDMFGRKAHRGGKSKERFTQNYATDSNRYELRVPYQTYTDSQHCIVELRDITVEAYNEFDTVGFAQLRVYQAGAEYYNKPIALSSKIVARQCDSFIHQWKDKTWSGGLGCYFYFDDKKISKEPEYNAEQVYFDFSQFNNDTVIHYDILAGENYRSEPLDPQTGE